MREGKGATEEKTGAASGSHTAEPVQIPDCSIYCTCVDRKTITHINNDAALSANGSTCCDNTHHILEVQLAGCNSCCVFMRASVWPTRTHMSWLSQQRGREVRESQRSWCSGTGTPRYPCSHHFSFLQKSGDLVRTKSCSTAGFLPSLLPLLTGGFVLSTSTA